MLESILNVIGVKLGIAAAAAMGAIISLVSTRHLTPIQAIISLFVGFSTSVYMTPFVVSYLQVSPNLENGIAFVFGLIGMNIVTGVLMVTDRFSKNPLDTVKKIITIKKEDEKE